MTDAPERIWIYTDEDGTPTSPEYSENPDAAHTIPYIRADLVPRWQPIETAPKDGTPVDIWLPDIGRCPDVWWDDGWGVPGEPTHWKPLDTPEDT